MTTTRIYIKSLKLRNIRTFGNEVKLNLDKKDGTIPQWTLILGDNGIGKSTLLQCLAWMKPHLPYDSKGIDQFRPEPILTNEENETLERLVQRSSSAQELKSAEISALFVANKKLNKTNSSKTEIDCETSIKIVLKDGKLNDVIANAKTIHRGVFYVDEVIMFGYSASRQLGKLNLYDRDMEETIPSFIAEKTKLYDAEEILHDLNYAALDSAENEENEARKYIEKIKKMLVSILPDVDKISDIEILPPKLKLPGSQGREANVVITTKYGTKIPFGNMSLGYKTVTSWTIDLAWRLFKKYPDSPNPLTEPAIVLIDEIDLHLHPLWQREIMDNLSKHFKNTQFIGTAHSPLMVQAAIESNYAVLIQHDDGVEILNDPKGIDGWRVDQILTSEMFGLKSSRGIRYENFIGRREELLNKKGRLTKKEKDELKTIADRLSKLPTGESIEEIENRKLISEVALKIKESNKKIEL